MKERPLSKMMAIVLIVVLIIGYNIIIYANQEESINTIDEENETQELTSEILTNKVYDINGENKRVVQVLLKSGFHKNAYPIKATNIEVSTLDGMEGINVISRGTMATNGKNEDEFNQSNWLYVQESKKVQIEVVNSEENGEINGAQNGQDEFVVTYILDENVNIENKEIMVTATITLNDLEQTRKTCSTTVTIAEEKDGMITTSTSVSEESIYKGKIYAKVERNYNVTTNIYVSSSKVENKIDINLKESTYQVENDRLSANVQYVTTKIEKSQVEKVLGEDGVIEIVTEDGTPITQINKDTQTDEDGKITINYPEGIKQIMIQSTQVVNTGIIKLESIKTIKPENYSREIIRQIQAINEYASDASDSNAKIALKETTTEAQIEVNNNHLSTLSTNENVEIKVTLCSDNEKYDLYNNPTIDIILPNSVENLNVKSINLIYGNHFTQDYAQVVEKSGRKVIQIGLKGEQDNYTSDINQTTIAIIADIDLGILTPTQVQDISVNYTNKNGKESEYHTGIDMEIESKYGLMIYSQMSGFNKSGNSEYTIDNDVPIGRLDVNCEERTATMDLAIVNNYDEDMTDVCVVGRIPAKGIYDGTIDTRLASKIETNLENITVLYSANSTAIAEDNSWTENPENAKSYKIVLDKIQKGQVIQTKYNFIIPEGLSFGQSLYGRSEIDYTYLGNRMSQTSNIGAETERLTVAHMSKVRNAVTTNLDYGLDIAISAMTAGSELHDGDSIYEGQTIKYIVNITNHTGTDLRNVKVHAVQENGNIYDLKEKDSYNDGTNEYNLKSYFWEELDTDTKEFNIENLKNEESAELIYQVVVKEVEDENAKTVGNITIETEGLETKTVRTMANTIKQAKLKMLINQANAEELDLYSLNLTAYVIQVKNLSKETLKDVAIQVGISEGLAFSEPHEVEIYLPNCDGKKADVLNGITTDNDIFTINLSKIEPGEDGVLNIVIRPYLTSFEGEQEEVSIYTKCVLSEKEAYFSNISNRTIYQMDRSITFTQTANVSEDTILEDCQEFEICIAIENKGSDVMIDINDFFETGLVATSGHWYTEHEKINTINIYEGKEDEEEEEDETEYIMVIDNRLIGNINLKKGTKLTIVINVAIDATKIEEDFITNILTLTYGSVTINSNELKFRVKEFKEDSSTSLSTITVEQTANPENKSTIKDNQELMYTTVIKNTIGEGYHITITDELPEGILATTVYLNGEDVTNQYLQDNNVIIDNYFIEDFATVKLQINAILVESKTIHRELKNFVSVATVRAETKSNEIIYLVSDKDMNNSNDNSNNSDDSSETNSNGSDNSSNGSNDNSNNSENKSNTSNTFDEKLYTISGVAWVDANKDGVRDTTENLCHGIVVKVVDVTTGYYVQKDGKDLSVTTTSDGTYSLQLGTGSYIIVFEYDTNTYNITQYQKTGVAQHLNSDVITKTVNNKKVAVTDAITLHDTNVENIDIGLIQITVFDLELNKYIDKVTVQNNTGTNIYQYDNSKIAKVEIATKQLSSSMVALEYTIKVTNTGETDGYVKSVVDYLPSSLEFDAKLNPNWYELNSNLYNTSLENTRIQAGETKDITLIVTKKMTENNTGTISNTAEIADAYNVLGISDIDSTPGNAISTEDDFSSADVIISVKTGALILYVSIIIIISLMIGFGIYFINKKVLKD